jgi:hypothetical protein
VVDEPNSAVLDSQPARSAASIGIRLTAHMARRRMASVLVVTVTSP